MPPHFDVKMDFTRKSTFVDNVSTPPMTSSSTYAGVESKETVSISFKYTALSGIAIMASEIHNAYLQALISEKY